MIDATSIWVFEPANGSQGHEHPSVGLGVWAWAVRGGDSEAVPVPPTAWLLLPAILAALVTRLRRVSG